MEPLPCAEHSWLRQRCSPIEGVWYQFPKDGEECTDQNSYAAITDGFGWDMRLATVAFTMKWGTASRPQLLGAALAGRGPIAIPRRPEKWPIFGVFLPHSKDGELCMRDSSQTLYSSNITVMSANTSAFNQLHVQRIYNCFQQRSWRRQCRAGYPPHRSRPLLPSQVARSDCTAQPERGIGSGDRDISTSTVTEEHSAIPSGTPPETDFFPGGVARAWSWFGTLWHLKYFYCCSKIGLECNRSCPTKS